MYVDVIAKTFRFMRYTGLTLWIFCYSTHITYAFHDFLFWNIWWEILQTSACFHYLWEIL